MTKDKKMLKISVKAESSYGKFNGEFTAYEVDSDSGYGNDKYISIVFNDDLWKAIDCRYIIGYNFKKTVEEVFKNHYGKNLKNYVKIFR